MKGSQSHFAVYTRLPSVIQTLIYMLLYFADMVEVFNKLSLIKWVIILGGTCFFSQKAFRKRLNSSLTYSPNRHWAYKCSPFPWISPSCLPLLTVWPAPTTGASQLLVIRPLIYTSMAYWFHFSGQTLIQNLSL